MAKKKVSKPPDPSIVVRGSSRARASSVRFGEKILFRGDVNIAGRDITNTIKTINIGFDEAQVAKLFDQLYKDLEANTKTPLTSIEDLKAEVKEIQSQLTDAAKKNEAVDEGFLARRFRNIARMAPDLLDVVVKTLVNPMLGIGEVAKKIAEKAKEEAKL